MVDEWEWNWVQKISKILKIFSQFSLWPSQCPDHVRSRESFRDPPPWKTLENGNFPNSIWLQSCYYLSVACARCLKRERTRYIIDLMQMIVALNFQLNNFSFLNNFLPPIYPHDHLPRRSSWFRTLPWSAKLLVDKLFSASQLPPSIQMHESYRSAS